MAHAELTIHLARGEHRVGLWCETCALPSRWELDLYSLTTRGVSTLVVAGCTEHSREEEDVD